MRCWPRVLVAAAALVFVAADAPVENGVFTTLARDVVLDQSVVVLDVPPNRADWRFLVLVQKKTETRYYLARAREGRHAYDFRDDPNWRGRAQVVVTNLPDARGVVRAPTSGDELDIFLAPELLQPSTVNVLPGHRLFDTSWGGVLLLVCVLGTLGFWAVTRRRNVSLLFGFCLAWAALDARTMADHFDIVRKHERNGRVLLGLEDAVPFAERAAPVIGDRSWTTDPSLDEQPLAKNYLTGYAFADRRYVPDRADGPAADFVITADPKQGPVVCSSGKLFLVRRGPR